jgi:hypothetical protein
MLIAVRKQELTRCLPVSTVVDECGGQSAKNPVKHVGDSSGVSLSLKCSAMHWIHTRQARLRHDGFVASSLIKEILVLIEMKEEGHSMADAIILYTLAL